MNHKDIIIIGGGLVGLTTAIAAAKAGLSCAVIEKGNPEFLLSKQSDGRVSAIALGSKEFLKNCDIWNSIRFHAGPIKDIRVTDNNSPFFLHFNHDLVGDEPLGYMVENITLLKALYEKTRNNPQIELHTQTQYTNIERNSDQVTVTLDNNKTITAQLLIAADGRHSSVRESAHIKTSSIPYGQTGIVCNVEHTLHHQETAVEHFMPSGPFAILPMHGGYHSSLVWTEKTEDAEYLLSQSKEELLISLHKRFGDFLGKLKIATPIFHYPLSLTTVKSYTATRLVLIGDAAHGIHPIAGQGLNLGIRDIEALLTTLKDQHENGLDIGSTSCLKHYAKKRAFDIHSMIAITHQLNHLFANAIPPIQIARQLGLASVNKITPLKKFFMKNAMGLNTH